MRDRDIRADLAIRVAREAGAQALAHWRDRGGLEIETKRSRQDLVSEADRAVERFIRTTIAAACPGDAILGEEFGTTPGRSGFAWVIDPIDGTSPFLHGLPHWCVAIAVTSGPETIAAAISVPVQGEIFAARLGGGATLDGAPLHLPAGLGLDNAATGIGASDRSDPADVARLVQRLLEAGGRFYCNGSGALMLASVAAGRLAGYVEAHMHAWDCLAGLLIIREAGGCTQAMGTDPHAGGAVLAAAPSAWEALCAVAER